MLYIFWSLHQTTTILPYGNILILLYIFWSLHQTTTRICCLSSLTSCISFDPYIKPQLKTLAVLHSRVVYLLIPTSNHNYAFALISFYVLYIFWSLHQTTTYFFSIIIIFSCISFDPYIKPQRFVVGAKVQISCISFDPYIKPQPILLICKY